MHARCVVQAHACTRWCLSVAALAHLYMDCSPTLLHGVCMVQARHLRTVTKGGVASIAWGMMQDALSGALPRSDWMKVG